MRAASELRTRNHECPDRSGVEVIRIIIAELKRAMAAEQRYAELKRGHAIAVNDDFGVADIPRRVFEEFYSSSC